MSCQLFLRHQKSFKCLRDGLHALRGFKNCNWSSVLGQHYWNYVDISRIYVNGNSKLKNNLHFLIFFAFVVSFINVSNFAHSCIQGGLKAAILSDVIQGLTMIGVSVVIIMHGTIDAGGFSTVVNVTSERGRLDFFKYALFTALTRNSVSARQRQNFLITVFTSQLWSGSDYSSYHDIGDSWSAFHESLRLRLPAKLCSALLQHEQSDQSCQVRINPCMDCDKTFFTWNL